MFEGRISQFIHQCNGSLKFVERKVMGDHFQKSKVFCLWGILVNDRSREPFEKGEGEFGLPLPQGKLGVS